MRCARASCLAALCRALADAEGCHQGILPTTWHKERGGGKVEGGGGKRGQHPAHCTVFARN